MTLDACTTFCATLGATFGSWAPNILGWVGTAALAWWIARKPAKQAKAAIAETTQVKLELAELKGSLRPPPATSAAAQAILSSASGTYEPVRLDRPSLADPSLSGTEPLPSPPAMPRDTPLERPRGK